MNVKNITLVSIILVELTIIVIEIVALLECKQCLLFGTIFEVKRIIEGGSTIWCYMMLINGIGSVFICTLLLLQRPVFGIQLSSSQTRLQTLFWMTICNVVMGCFVAFGWQQFCKTFKVVRCHLMDTLKLIDWRTYTPKYSRCSNNYIYYNIFQFGLLWCSLACLSLFVVHYKRRTRTL